jgi:hypothetical protein
MIPWCLYTTTVLLFSIYLQFDRACAGKEGWSFSSAPVEPLYERMTMCMDGVGWKAEIEGLLWTTVHQGLSYISTIIEKLFVHSFSQYFHMTMTTDHKGNTRPSRSCSSFQHTPTSKRTYFFRHFTLIFYLSLAQQHPESPQLSSAAPLVSTQTQLTHVHESQAPSRLPCRILLLKFSHL